MSATQKELEALELRISYFLRYGVLLAGFFLVIGWVWGFLNDPSKLPFASFSTYQPESLGANLTAKFQAHDYASLVAYFGLIVLISLPMLRVLTTCWLFMKSRDLVLAAVAAVVLVALLVSFSLGIEL